MFRGKINGFLYIFPSTNPLINPLLYPSVIHEIGTSNCQDSLCGSAPVTQLGETGIEGVDCRFQQRCVRGCQGRAWCRSCMRLPCYVSVHTVHVFTDSARIIQRYQYHMYMYSYLYRIQQIQSVGILRYPLFWWAATPVARRDPVPPSVMLIHVGYPLAIHHNHGESPCLMGKLTINGHFQ